KALSDATLTGKVADADVLDTYAALLADYATATGLELDDSLNIVEGEATVKPATATPKPRVTPEAIDELRAGADDLEVQATKLVAQTKDVTTDRKDIDAAYDAVLSAQLTLADSAFIKGTEFAAVFPEKASDESK